MVYLGWGILVSFVGMERKCLLKDGRLDEKEMEETRRD